MDVRRERVVTPQLCVCVSCQPCIIKLNDGVLLSQSCVVFEAIMRAPTTSVVATTLALLAAASSTEAALPLVRSTTAITSSFESKGGRHGNMDALLLTTLANIRGGSSEDNNGRSTDGGWGGLFGKKETSSATDTDTSADNNSGFFEITMNSSPEGNRNVKVDIETPQSVKNEINATLTKLENTINQQQQQLQQQEKSMATLLTNGGGPTTTTQQPHLSNKFPISKAELPHFLSMSILMFLFIYVFTTVRDTKDTLVVSNCGAEAIPFLKLYGVMPCAAMFIVAYSKLSNVLSKSGLFYVTLVPFFVFYGVFAFVLFPNRDLIHFPPAEAAGAAVGGGGGALTAATNLLRYWSFSLFFIVSELWASAGVPLLFWQVSICIFLIFHHH